jgi:hypothetical protein
VVAVDVETQHVSPGGSGLTAPKSVVHRQLALDLNHLTGAATMPPGQ